MLPSRVLSSVHCPLTFLTLALLAPLSLWWVSLWQNLLKFVAKHVVPAVVALTFVHRSFSSNPLATIGLLYVLYLLFKVVLYPVYFRLKISTWGRVDVRKYGDYAVVTGGTSGMGEAFVRTFGKAGLNVIVVSRSASKLDKLKKEFESEFPGQKCQVLAYDFGDVSDSAVSSFQKDFRALVSKVSSVGILVNNVGLSNDTPEYLHLIPEDDIKNMLNVNNNGE